jgi:hypothetical protein
MRFSLLSGEWRRLGLVLGGEGLQSGLHFGLNLALIALLPAREYGAFAFVLVLGGVGLVYVRSLAAMPASTYIGRARRAVCADFYEGAFGAAALVLSAVIAAAAAAILSISSTDAAFGGAAVVGLWSLRSFLRTVGFARRQAFAVTLGDAAFATTGVVAGAAALTFDGDRLEGVLGALALANVVGAATIALARGRRPRADFGRRARRFYFRLALRLAWSLYSVTATVLLGQGVAFLVVAFAGPAAFAPIAAMLAFFAPLRIFSMSLANMLQPEVARTVRLGDEAGWRRLRSTWTRRACLLAFLYGAVCLTILPHLRLRSMAHQPILFIALCAWWVYATALGYLLPRIFLEARMRFREIAVITTLAALVSLAATATLLIVAAPGYALIGAALGESAAALATWRRAAGPPTGRRPAKPRIWRGGLAQAAEAESLL